VQALKHNVQRTYIAKLGVTVYHIAPGQKFSTYAAAYAAVVEFGCPRGKYIKGMVPEVLSKGSRSSLYKTIRAIKEQYGYTAFAFAVGPLATAKYGERGGRKIVLGVLQ